MPRPYPSLRTNGDGPTQHWRAPGGQRNRAILLTGCAMTGPGRASYKNVSVGGRECGSYGMKSDSENLLTTLVGGEVKGGSPREEEIKCTAAPDTECSPVMHRVFTYGTPLQPPAPNENPTRKKTEPLHSKGRVGDMVRQRGEQGNKRTKEQRKGERRGEGKGKKGKSKRKRKKRTDPKQPPKNTRTQTPVPLSPPLLPLPCPTSTSTPADHVPKPRSPGVSAGSRSGPGMPAQHTWYWMLAAVRRWTPGPT